MLSKKESKQTEKRKKENQKEKETTETTKNDTLTLYFRDCLEGTTTVSLPSTTPIKQIKFFDQFKGKVAPSRIYLPRLKRRITDPKFCRLPSKKDLKDCGLSRTKCHGTESIWIEGIKLPRKSTFVFFLEFPRSCGFYIRVSAFDCIGDVKSMISTKWPKYRKEDWSFSLKTFGKNSSIKENKQKFLRDSQRLEELTIKFSSKHTPTLIGWHLTEVSKEDFGMDEWFTAGHWPVHWPVVSPLAEKVLSRSHPKHIRGYLNSMHNTTSEPLPKMDRRFIVKRLFKCFQKLHQKNKVVNEIQKLQKDEQLKLNCQFITRYDFQKQKQIVQNFVLQNSNLLSCIASYLEVKNRCLIKSVSPFWFSRFSDITVWKIQDVLEWFLLKVNKGNLNNIFWNMNNLCLYKTVGAYSNLSFTPWEITLQDMEVQDQDELFVY